MYSSYNKLKISISHYYSGSIKIDNLLVWKRIPKYSQIRKKSVCPHFTKEASVFGNDDKINIFSVYSSHVLVKNST